MKISVFANELITGKRRVSTQQSHDFTPQHVTQAGLDDIGSQYLAGNDLRKLLHHLEQQRHNPAAVALAIAVCGRLHQQGELIHKMQPYEYISQQLLPTLYETGHHAELIRDYIQDIQHLLHN